MADNASVARADEVDIDPTVPHAARVYDYLLGGTVNFEVDRRAAEQQAATLGGVDVVRGDLKANRAFMGRAVRYLAGEAGIRQFLDIGTGIPNADDVHGVAQSTAPEARVVYVDNDPIVLAHSHMLLDSTPQGARAYVDGDLRDPDVIFEHASATLDLSQPVAIMLVAILHLTPDDQDPYGIVARLLDGVPSGSHLVVSHMASDIAADEMADLARSAPKEAKYTFAMRTRPEVTRFFDGLELVEPGVVPVREWRPDGSAQPGGDDRVTAMYGAVGRKP